MVGAAEHLASNCFQRKQSLGEEEARERTHTTGAGGTSRSTSRRRRPLIAPEALRQLKNDLAVVVAAEALFALTDLHGMPAEAAIASIVHTATTLTRAALA